MHKQSVVNYYDVELLTSAFDAVLMSGDSEELKLKFKNVGLLDVSKPIFINNRRFVHSLVYTGNVPRGVLLAYGIRQPK